MLSFGDCSELLHDFFKNILKKYIKIFFFSDFFYQNIKSQNKY